LQENEDKTNKQFPLIPKLSRFGNILFIYEINESVTHKGVQISSVTYFCPISFHERKFCIFESLGH